tara:strand:+ start:463 stop:783 length:321 start_codon:yes stop_codon:yes gene_type:complete
LRLLKKKEKEMFKVFDDPVAKHFAKLLTTEYNDLFSLEKDDSIKVFNKINSNSNQIGNMSFKYENKEYNVKFKSIYGVPFILDNTNSNNKIIMRKFDLSRISFITE